MDEINYVGKWTAFGRAVFVEAGNLSHPLIVGEREPACGLGWRDEATEIARALLLHATSDEELAGRLCTAFAEAILASLPPAGFRLSREGILSWVDDRVASQAEAPRPAASSQVQPASRPRMRLVGMRLVDGGGAGPDPPAPIAPIPPRGPNRRRSVAGPTHRAA